MASKKTAAGKDDLMCTCFFCGSERRAADGSDTGGALSTCSRCHTAFYCSTECQRSDWPEHKKTCKRLTSAAPGRPLALSSGALPRISDLFEAVSDPLCISLRHAAETGGPTAKLALLLLRHGMPRVTELPAGEYAEVARLLAAGADPCCDLRIFPDEVRAEAAAKRLATARSAGRSVPETSHVRKENMVLGVSSALSIALRCGDSRLLDLISGDRAEGAPPLRPNALTVIDTGCFVSPLAFALAAPPPRVLDMVRAALSLGADPNAPVAWTVPKARAGGGAEAGPGLGPGVGGGADGVQVADDDAAAAAVLGPRFARLRLLWPLSLVTASHNGCPVLPPDTVEALTRALAAAGARLDAFDCEGLPHVTAALRQLHALPGSFDAAEFLSFARFFEVLLELGAGPNVRAVAPSLPLRPIDFLAVIPVDAGLPPELTLRALRALKRASASFLPLPFQLPATSPEGVASVSAADYLQMCIVREKVGVLRFVLSPEGGGVSPDTRSALASKGTLLNFACVTGTGRCVEALLEAGADPRLHNGISGTRPLDELRSLIAAGPSHPQRIAVGGVSDQELKAVAARLERATMEWAGRPEPPAFTSPLLRLPTADDARIIAAGGCPLGDLAAQRSAGKMRIRQPLGDVLCAAERGDLIAQYVLAEAFHEGIGGMPKNHAAAVTWARHAAAGNVADACALLGCAYEVGEGGLPAASPEALPLYLRAAEAGQALARYRLGVCYAKGRGTVQDTRVAVQHWRLAADAGYAPAQADLANACVQGTGTAVDYATARHYALLAEAQGHSHGPLQLGILAYNGWGEPVDTRKGIAYWLKSASMEDSCVDAQAANILRDQAARGDTNAVEALRQLQQQQEQRQ